MALWPAKYPVLQQFCKLKPPVSPSISIISPAKNKLLIILDFIVLPSISTVKTPPLVAIARSNPKRDSAVSSIFFNKRNNRPRSSLVKPFTFFSGSIFESLAIAKTIFSRRKISQTIFQTFIVIIFKIIFDFLFYLALAQRWIQVYKNFHFSIF